MSATGVDCPHAPSAETELRASPVRRTAFYLTSQGQPLFAWLHTSPGLMSFDHGVIVCPPIGYEQLHAHRGLRHLADTLAARGIPVLRFDWHGTGDSAGSDDDPGRCAAWLANCGDTAEWMRNELGCRQLSIVGLRMGALLAAKALGQHDFDNFVLWAPVTSGRSYVREMQLIDRTAETQPRAGAAKQGDIEAAGFVLSSETAAELTGWNLLQLQPKCRRALIVARSDGPADNRLLDRFSALGIAAEQVVAPGTAEMFCEPHYNQVPEVAIREIESWLCRQIFTVASPELAIDVETIGPGEAVMWHEAEAPASGQCGRFIREQTCRISADPDLFGILSEPATPGKSLPTIVLLNSGSAYRIGTGRLNLVLARRFAAEGFRCLRMDLCGLGDSVSADSAHENNPYPATTFRDIEIALGELRSRLGIERFVLLGLCSGAYAAFQSAAQLSDAALVESVLINPLTYFWKDGMTLDAPSIQQNLQRHRYLARALEPKMLLKFFSGRTQIGFIGAGRLLAQWLAQRSPWRCCSDKKPSELPPSADLGHPQRKDLPGDLARVAAAGRNLAMFFATTDPGYSILNSQARRQANRLRQIGKLQVAFIKDADHTFSRRGPRNDLIDALTDHLRRRYQQSE